MTRKFKLLKNQKGMTLIELLAVVVVLGIIMAIAVPSVSGVINRSKVNADIGSLEIIKDAALRYALAENTGATTAKVQDLVDKGYLNKVPTSQSGKISGFGSVAISFSGNTYSVAVYVEDNAQTTEITESLLSS